jgi:glycosyltransferase involved in cell wall biosynthesis
MTIEPSDPKVSGPECSVIVPLYRNEANVPRLLERLEALDRSVPGGIEAVCVVDGSPDLTHALLVERLPRAPYRSRLLLLSRNFGSFAAIREGLRCAGGRWFAVMAADLQEPQELVEAFFRALRADEADVVLGTRAARADGLAERTAANAFWGLYRRLINPEVPPGGVDVFGCNAAFRERLLGFQESNSSLIGQLLWLGFRRKTVPYAREARDEGVSAWTFRRKAKYLLDNVFAFSDLPIKVFTALGILGLLASVVLGAVVVAARLSGAIEVPGYTPTILAISFFASLNLLALGIMGSYVWRAYENTKARPLAVVMRAERYGPPSP